MITDSKQDLHVELSADGSQTLYSMTYGQHYHSMHGALAESEHVFIKEGLDRTDKSNINVLEFGFGSGLNALLTLREAIARNIHVAYVGLELHPVPPEVWSLLNYEKIGLKELMPAFQTMHEAPWEQATQIHPLFQLKKLQVDMVKAELEDGFDLVYFDAFGPATQPELWCKEIFERIFFAMAPGSILTTYSCKGDVRRSMMDIGYSVEKVTGPPGKRSMLVAIKD